MTAKEYLKQLQRLNTIIKQKMDEQKQLLSMAESVRGIDYSY